MEVDAGDTIRAEAAVVAVPVRLVTELAFDPPLAADQRAAFEGLPMGVASKVAVPLEGAPERCAIQCADLPFWFWVADGVNGTRRVVTSFAGSEIPQGPLETATGDPRTWIDRIVELAPELRPAGTAVMKVWAEDPLARGAYSAWDGPSLARRHLFERMHGAVAFAGEHTAGDHSGTMEGALRSGQAGGRPGPRVSSGEGERSRARESEGPFRRPCIMRRTPGPARERAGRGERTS